MEVNIWGKVKRGFNEEEKPYCLCNLLSGKRQCCEEDSSTREELKGEVPEYYFEYSKLKGELPGYYFKHLTLKGT